MKRLLGILAASLLIMSSASAQDAAYPVSAWTTRQVNTFSEPQAGKEDGGFIAATGRVTWLDTQGEWAFVDAHGIECYVPKDALTTDRVFHFDSHPTKSVDWPYEGEMRLSPDGTLRISIWLKEECSMLFGGAELCRFEVMDEYTGELICTAQLDLSGDPVIYNGEGVYRQGTALRVVPVLRHDGYSVEIQW